MRALEANFTLCSLADQEEILGPAGGGKKGSLPALSTRYPGQAISSQKEDKLEFPGKQFGASSMLPLPQLVCEFYRGGEQGLRVVNPLRLPTGSCIQSKYQIEFWLRVFPTA